MPVVNPLARELVFKVVYYGPGLGGKTTTLQHIHASTRPEHRGKMVSLATPVDRTLYFDFLPLRLATLHGMGVRLQLFTVPGQVYYNATRKLVLTGADAVVFVADSQRARLDANLESLENLRDNLAEHGRSLDELPFLLAYNKRDLGDIVPVEELERRLNRHGAPYFETCATSGVGVFEALDALARLVLEDFERRMPEAQAQLSPGGFRLAEGGLVEALRAADQDGARDEPRVVREELEEDEAPVGESAALAVVGEGARASERSRSVPPLRPEPLRPELSRSERLSSSTAAVRSEPEAESFPLSESGEAAVATSLASVMPRGPAPSTSSALSFVVLWGEEDRVLAREVEGNLQRAEWAAAVLGCGALVRRCLGRAALEGEGELLAVTLLACGVDAARYLWLRQQIVAARAGAVPDRTTALTAYLFAVEVARRTRELSETAPAPRALQGR